MTSKALFPDIAPPATEERPVEDTRHGVTRTDEFAWLRADNWQEVFRDPSAPRSRHPRRISRPKTPIRRAMLADTADLRKQLFQEMKGRIKEDDSSVPMPDGPFAYGSSFKKGGEQPRFFRTPRDGGEQDIILDGDREAEGKAYFRIGGSRALLRPPAPLVGLRRQGFGILHAAGARPRKRRRPRRRGRRYRRVGRLDCRQ